MSNLEYANEIVRMLEEMGYTAPKVGEMPSEYMPKLYKFVSAIYVERGTNG